MCRLSSELALRQIDRVDVDGEVDFFGEFQVFGEFGQDAAEFGHLSGAKHDLETEIGFGSREWGRGGAGNHQVF